MHLKDIYDQLKSLTIGTNTSKIDSKLDSAIDDIATFKSESGRNGYIDLVKSLIAQGGTIQLDQFNQMASTPAVMGQGTRLARYKAYEAITTNIPYCNRALNVLVDNILSPDDITKTVLDIKTKQLLDSSEKSNSDIRNVREIISKTKIEERLDLIVKNTLHLGDFFCEIADAKTALTSKSSFLSESLILDATYANFNNHVETINVQEDLNRDFAGMKIIMDYSAMDDVKIDNLTTMNHTSDIDSQIPGRSKKLKKDPSDIHLLYYDPKRVVKLQSEMFPLCFGYLIFPSTTFAPHLMIQNQVINTLCQSILRNVQQKIPGLKVDNIKQDDLKDMIGKMISEGDASKIMNIRYVPPDKIQHFSIPTTKYYPYGESVFDSSQFSAKVLIALETALTIARINRSTEKRKIAVEIGLPRDARKLIEKLKEEFRKRKISIDAFGTVDTIPSMISTFEDVYIPQKDGKSFVDISTFNEGNMDVRSKVDELKMLRDQLVAGLGVPPSYIGIEENLCLSLQSIIKLTDGRNITLDQLIKEHKNGIKHEVYSYDDESGVIFTNKVLWAGKTKLRAKIMRIWLTNGQYVDCTPDHPFLLKDNTYEEAQNLYIDDYLMTYDDEERIQVFKMERLKELCDTGDITVEKCHNFVLDVGIVVHNSNKAALGEENILFARTLINHQKYLTHQINELIEKIYKIIDPEEALTILDNVIIAFQPPKTLQVERESQYLSNLANLVETLERIGIPKEWSKKQYMTNIDWDEVNKYEIISKIDTSLKLDKEDPSGMGDMSGMGGGMGGGLPY